MIPVLFVHSDQKLSEIYLRHLRPHFQIDSAFDGLSALRKLKLTDPRIVVSDYNLPLVSGINLLQYMRSTPRFAITPFLFFSDHDDAASALSFGANDWIDFRLSHPDYLLDRIYHHLKQNQQLEVRY